MGCSLIWTKSFITAKDYLDDELKHILEKDYQFPCRMDRSDLGYLKGLKSAGIKGAHLLIEVIEKYNEILVKYEC